MLAIGPVTDSKEKAAAEFIRQQVFENEWRIRLQFLTGPENCPMLTLLALADTEPRDRLAYEIQDSALR